MIKEVVEINTDWTRIEWIRGPIIIATKHKILEGADAPGLRARLTVHISKSPFNTTNVVIEVEALALRGDETALINISKGVDGGALIFPYFSYSRAQVIIKVIK